MPHVPTQRPADYIFGLAGDATARVVRLEGLEPPTRGLEGRCSFHLSYRRAEGPMESRSRGTRGRIRTCDPQLRRLVLYPAELRAHEKRRGL